MIDCGTPMGLRDQHRTPRATTSGLRRSARFLLSLCLLGNMNDMAAFATPKLSRRPQTKSSTTTLGYPTTTARKPPFSSHGLAASFRSGEAENRTPKYGSEMKTPQQLKNEALNSITSCYKLALGAGVVGAATYVFDHSANIYNMTPLEGATLLGKLHLILFGGFLYRSSTLFREATRGGNRLNATYTHELAKILSRMWALTAWVRSMHTLAYSFALKHTPLFKMLSVGILVVNFPLCNLIHRHFSNQRSKESPVEPEFRTARRVGLTAVRNVLCCVVPMGVLGLTELVESVITALETKQHHVRAWTIVNGLLDSAEWLAIATLLLLLYQQLLRTTLKATQCNSPNNNFLCELFKVQAELYSKIGAVFATMIVFTLLPYLLPAATDIYGVYTTLDGIRGVIFP